MPQPARPLPGQRRRPVGQKTEDLHNDIYEDYVTKDRTSMPTIYQLHDNSVGQTRGWGEPLLFVPDSPQAIGPSGPRLLEYDWENSGDGGPQFSIMSETDDDRHAHDSIRLLSAHRLCFSCKDTFNYFCRYQEPRQDSQGMKNNVVHSASLSSLLMSAGLEQCFICRQTWAKIQSMYPDLNPLAYSDYRIECCWYPATSAGNEIKMWMVMYNPSMKKRPVHNYQHILRLGFWPKTHFGTHFDKETNQREAVVSRGSWDDCNDDDTNNHTDTRSLVLTWLSRCMQDTDGQHDVCNQKDGAFLPSRLLDVRYALEKGTVRLVCPTEVPEAFASGPGYASLSHCWGARGAKENPLLLSTNMATRKSKGLEWDKLPQSFQDAFKISSWLRLDWIWIDSLCVIQDSKSDWQKEASMMDKVYMNAEVNISADLGEDSQAGCFAKRKEVDITLLEFEACELEQPWIVTTEDTFGWMNSARSLSRAWIHRERQLSRRILHFTAKEVVWECCGLGKACFASERFPGGAPFEKVFNGEIKFQIQRDVATATASDGHTSKQDQLDKLQKLWNSTCQDLSNKSITYPSDLPIILSSLAREFHAFMPNDEYVAGLWRSTLAEGLTWHVPGDKPDYSGYIAPSWSWLSAASPVKLHVPGHRQRKRALIDILDINIHPGPSSDNTYGQLAEGSSLRVNGFLRRLHFHFTGHENGGIILSVVEADANGQDRLRTIGADWDNDLGLTFRLTTDSALVLPYQEFECYALFTTLEEWAQFHWDCTRRLSCILLEKVAQENNTSQEKADNRYRRIGTLEDINDINSFKLRYRVAPEATVPEAGLPREKFDENPSGYTGQPWVLDEDSTATTQQDQEPKREVAERSEGTAIESNSTGVSSNETGDSVGNNGDDESGEDIWDSLTLYIRWHRWRIIQKFKKKERRAEKAASTKAKESDDEENNEEIQEDDEDDSHTHSEASSHPDALREGNTTASAPEHGERRAGRTGTEPRDDTIKESEAEVDVKSSSSNDKDNDSGKLSVDGEEQDEEGDNDKESINQDQDPEETEEQREQRQELIYLIQVIAKILNHPSSDQDPIAEDYDKDNPWERMTKIVSLEPETVAYGSDQLQDLEATLYQFDDVLDLWREAWGVVPWLRRLESCEVILI